MMKIAAAITGMALMLGLATPALADDPFDPEMQSAAARARDRELIRRLNADMLAQVTERDARYAQGWREYREFNEGRHPAQLAYRRDMADWEREQQRYAQDRRDYERAMEQWREDVNDCRRGDYRACR